MSNISFLIPEVWRSIYVKRSRFRISIEGDGPAGRQSSPQQPASSQCSEVSSRKAEMPFLLYRCPFRDIVIANYATGADAGYNSQPAQKESAMSNSAAIQRVQKIKEPKNLSERITWLRDYYFQGAGRAWNNEFTAWTTGTPWDVQFDEMTFYIVPETYAFLQTLPLLHAAERKTGGAPPRFLDLEPARAQGLVRPGGDGELRAPGDPAGGSDCGRPLQPPDLQVLDRERGQGARQAHLRERRACGRR